jgi:hypothetical protein
VNKATFFGEIMKRTILLIAAAAVCNIASADQLFNNGPVVNSAGRSVIAAGETTFGLSASGAIRVADDFTVTAGERWNLTSIDFFSYQTGATGFTFGNANWSIVSGDVNGDVVASGTTAVTNGGLAGYRVTATTTTNTTRPIFTLNADITDTQLNEGHYWLRWNLTGSLASGPWVAMTSDNRAGNAAQSITSGGAFSTYLESASHKTHELPFALNGNVVTAVPEPETWAMMLGGLGALAMVARRRKNKQA